MSTRRRRQAAARPGRTDGEVRPVNLALQGGGSHGAFTWGVLDALLEDGRIGFEAVTGASAGAINAVVMADGWRRGAAAGDARAGARAALRRFWTDVGREPSPFAFASAWPWSSGAFAQGSGWFGPWAGFGGAPGTPPSGPFGAVRDAFTDALSVNPVALWLDLVSRVLSPYQLNPLNVNPLRRVLGQHVDFDALRAAPPFKLFLAATNVRSGRPRIFREGELTLDMAMASACLPNVFQAVAIEGEGGTEHYWDGGYMGNPALWPLFYATRSCDLLLVQINPLARDELPDSAQEIAERVNEISFNASLLHEMRAIEFVQRLLAEKRLDPARYRRVLLHMIAAEAQMRAYGASSKYNTAPAFLAELFDLGRATARRWLDDHIAYVGHAGTVRIAEKFL